MDSCWFDQSPFAKFDQITYGSWQVDQSNVWQYDGVGWGANQVTWYRNAGRAPCDTWFPQRMVIDCGLDTDLACYIAANILRAGFTDTAVWSERAGVREERTWP